MLNRLSARPGHLSLTTFTGSTVKARPCRAWFAMAASASSDLVEVTVEGETSDIKVAELTSQTETLQITDTSQTDTPTELINITQASVGAAASDALKKLRLEQRRMMKEAKALAKLEKKAAKMDALPGPLITPAGDLWPPPYYFEDGLRRVRPYHFTYNTWCKERWRGLSLIDIFTSEFRDRPAEYYRTAMEMGDIYVNLRRVGPDYMVRNGDQISHTMHRHEPPVTDEPIGIIHEDGDMIVINKPAGVPVHPAGRYNFNSVNAILRAERGFHFMPYPCNRLDRLTSGIMFVGKSPRAALELGAQIRDRLVRKEYLARVLGRFPDGEVVCNEPILQISPKLGLNRVRANGKSARTVFKRLAHYPSRPTTTTMTESEKQVDDDDRGYSIVRCLPVTGRTHQIRVHLQHLGHPIGNDPIYANRRVWGSRLGMDDAEGTHTRDEDVMTRLSRMGKEEAASAVACYDEMVEDYERRRAEKLTGGLCGVCATPLYSDPGRHELALWLHSLRYEAVDGSWSYTSRPPGWAMPPEGMGGPTTVGGMEELVSAGES